MKKKNLLGVMLFGALALATGASFVGCKDYDDDVKICRNRLIRSHRIIR